MVFHVLTLFPEMVRQALGASIIGRAMDRGLIDVHAVNIRDYTLDKHGKVDDYPYGGGAGMLIQAQPVFDAYQSVARGRKLRTVYVTPQGRPFTQQMARELSQEEDLVLLCGHYEGIDERVLQEIVTDYVSIGDYVLTGGELPAMVMIDAIARLVPGVLNNETSAQTESFHNDLLEYPQYSRPVLWHDREVPSVLLSGNHREIQEWRRERSEERTAAVRPDLYARYQKKQKAIRKLSLHKREHIHIMEMLRRGKGELLYDKEEDVLTYDRESGTFYMTASTVEGAYRLVEQLRKTLLLPPENGAICPGERSEWFVVNQEYLKEMLIDTFGAEDFGTCIQACYTSREALPVKHKDIRRLDLSHLDYLEAHYEYGDREYLLDRLQAGTMYGAFVEDRLAGFIGLHDEGSMGLLYVEEEYRRRGLGASLEAYLINRQRELDWTPYCHIMENNRESLALQEKLGLYLSSGKLWWLRAGRFPR